MGFVKEFKEFAVKGNVMDLAVGVIIGAAFGKIITSVVEDLIMPIVGAIIGKPDFSDLYLVLRGDVPSGTSLATARTLPDTAILAYGNFATVAINFLLLALVVFMLVKGMNNLRKKKEEQPAEPAALSTTDQLLSDIKEELRKSKS